MKTVSILTLGIVVIGALVVFLLPIPTANDLDGTIAHSTSYDIFPPAIQSKAPNALLEHFQYNFGRFKELPTDISFHTDLDWATRIPYLLQQKKWHYTSINTEKYFLALAFVQLQYAGDVFMYLVDKESLNFAKYEYTGRLPGRLGMLFAESSIDDKTCTSFQSFGPDTLKVCYVSQSKEWVFNVNATLKNDDTSKSILLESEFYLKNDEPLALLFPLGNSKLRPAYVHKGAGSESRGYISIGNKVVDKFDGTKALGAIDWTKSLALRYTTWKWASTSCFASVKHSSTDETKLEAIGINLSSDVYDIDKESQENAIWINGKVYTIPGVEFILPKDRLQDTWKIVSKPKSTMKLNLTFKPYGYRADDANILIIKSQFVQPYGVFNGEITFYDENNAAITVTVKDAFGVVEDHVALW